MDRLFYFDENQIYIRGPLNRIGYLVMAIEMLMLVLCYMRNRRSVSRPVVRLIRTMPVIAASVLCSSIFIRTFS